MAIAVYFVYYFTLHTYFDVFFFYIGNTLRCDKFKLKLMFLKGTVNYFSFFLFNHIIKHAGKALFGSSGSKSGTRL